MRRLPLVLAAAALVLVACSGDDAPLVDRATTTTAPTSTTTTAPPSTTTTPTTAPAPTVAPTTTIAPTDLFGLRPPAPAQTPAGLAKQITAAETTLRAPASDDRAVATAALAQQVSYRQLGRHPEWDADVLAALPTSLRRVAELQAAARREFSAMHTTFKDTLPAWHVVAPPDADALLAAYHDADAAFGISWKYLAAINLVETQLGRIRGASSAGALGPMQFMPATWAAYGDGGNIEDVHDSVMAAARYLAANNGKADIDHALWRYNHSDRYVRGVRFYADLIAENPRAFFGFYQWGVWYLTSTGDVYLPVGYREEQPIKVSDYQAR